MAQDSGAATRSIAGMLASGVRWLGLIVAGILAIHVVLVAGEANPANGIAQFINDLSDVLSVGFKDLFNKPADDPKLQVFINYGIAAVFWLVATHLLARLIRRFG